MKTPLLNSIQKLAFVDLNGGFRYFPMDIDPKAQTKVEEPELPQVVQDAQKARGISNKKAPKGPQATALTASKDNVANYQAKGIS